MANTGEKIGDFIGGVTDPVLGDVTTTKTTTDPGGSSVSWGAIIGLSILGIGIIVGGIYLLKG